MLADKECLQCTCATLTCTVGVRPMHVIQNGVAYFAMEFTKRKTNVNDLLVHLAINALLEVLAGAVLAQASSGSDDAVSSVFIRLMPI